MVKRWRDHHHHHHHHPLTLITFILPPPPRCPHKIDLGAVYNARPSDHKKLTNFTPQVPHKSNSARSTNPIEGIIKKSI